MGLVVGRLSFPFQFTCVVSITAFKSSVFSYFKKNIIFHLFWFSLKLRFFHKTTITRQQKCLLLTETFIQFRMGCFVFNLVIFSSSLNFLIPLIINIKCRQTLKLIIALKQKKPENLFQKILTENDAKLKQNYA